MIYTEVALGHDLLQLPQAERSWQVPGDAQDDHGSFEVSPLEQRWRFRLMKVKAYQADRTPLQHNHLMNTPTPEKESIPQLRVPCELGRTDSAQSYVAPMALNAAHKRPEPKPPCRAEL